MTEVKGGGPKTEAVVITPQQAWESAQAQLAREIAGYPELFSSHMDLIQQVFTERRRASTTRNHELRLEINAGVSVSIRQLDEPVQDLLIPVFKVITNMFDVKNPFDQPRPWKS